MRIIKSKKDNSDLR